MISFIRALTTGEFPIIKMYLPHIRQLRLDNFYKEPFFLTSIFFYEGNKAV